MDDPWHPTNASADSADLPPRLAAAKASLNCVSPEKLRSEVNTTEDKKRRFAKSNDAHWMTTSPPTIYPKHRKASGSVVYYAIRMLKYPRDKKIGTRIQVGKYDTEKEAEANIFHH